MNKLANCQHDMKDLEEAESLNRERLELRIKAFGERDLWTVWTMGRGGLILMQLGRYREAEGLFCRALEVLEKRFSWDHRRIAKLKRRIEMVVQQLDIDERHRDDVDKEAGGDKEAENGE